MSVDINVEVKCECGSVLKADWWDDYNGARIAVEPCEDCLQNKYEEGHKEGYEEREAEES